MSLQELQGLFIFIEIILMLVLFYSLGYNSRKDEVKHLKMAANCSQTEAEHWYKAYIDIKKGIITAKVTLAEVKMRY